MLYSVIEHLASIFDIVILLVFLNFIFDKKKKSLFLNVLFVVLGYVPAQYMSQYAYVQLGCMIFILSLYSIIMLKGNIIHQIVCSVMCLAVYIIVNQTAMSLISIITGKPILVLLTLGEVLRIYSLIVSKILQIIVFFVIALIVKRKKYTSRHKFESIIVIILLIINLLVILAFLALNIELEIKGFTQIIWFCISVFIVAMLAICISLVLRFSNLNEVRTMNKLLIQQVNTQKEMIEKAYVQQNETMLLRHDMKHYVNIWLNEAQNMDIENMKAEMLKYLNRLDETVQKITYIKNNKLINSVLYEKKKNSDESKINCDYKIQCNFQIEHEMEIAVVIANLMDNAIRAELNESEENRFIKLDMFNYNDKLNIVVTNYISKSVLKENTNLKTTQQESKGHGYGIKSVKKLISECGGIINITENNDEFIVHIQI